MSLNRLKWLAIVLPLSFLVALDYLRHGVLSGQLHELPGGLLLFALLAVGVASFSFLVFGEIGRLEERIVGQNRQLRVLNQIAGASATNLQLQELLNFSLDSVLDVMKAEAGVICLLDSETEELVASCYRGLSEEVVQRIRRQKLSDDPIGSQVVKTGRLVVIEKIMEHPEVAEAARREGVKAAVSVPLKSEGQVTGVLAVATRHDRVFTADELDLLTNIGGQLGLAVRNAVLFVKAEQRNHELQALLAVARAGASSLDLPEMLDQALDAVLDVTSADTAEVWLADDKGDLAIERLRGLASEAFRDRGRLHRGEGIPGIVAATGEPIVTHDLASDRRFVRQTVLDLGFQTYCALPLRQRGETVGVLGVASRDPAALTSWAERRLLEGIGEQLAIAVDNGRLHQRVLDVAVLEERERIARELHDGLAQVLGYINTQTLAIRKLVAAGRTQDAQEQLYAMEEAAREVYADIREAILGLRVLTVPGAGLVDGLRTYAQRYSEMAGVPINIESNGDAASLRLPRSTEIQLMRIIQEALSNVRKHAHAEDVTIRFATANETLAIEVADDGAGFDKDSLAPTGWPRFGLQTMRERAEAIGGKFVVDSAPRKGTRVTVEVPLRRHAEETDESLAGR